MTWSIERLEEGYGLVETIGEVSETVYTAKRARDAKRLIQAFEVYELVQNGAPVEVWPKIRAKRRKG